MPTLAEMQSEKKAILRHLLLLEQKESALCLRLFKLEEEIALKMVESLKEETK